MTHALSEPQSILSAALIAVESLHTLLVRCLDGRCHLGQPARFDSNFPSVCDGCKRGHLSLTMLERLADPMAIRLTRGIGLDNDAEAQTQPGGAARTGRHVA